MGCVLISMHAAVRTRVEMYRDWIGMVWISWMEYGLIRECMY
jgi:hypothetical protein